MRIAIIGAGYVGLVSGACFAEFGVDVTCVDTNSDKIKALKNGKCPIYEPGLDDLIVKQMGAKRLSFTTDLAEALDNAQAVFIAVGTPPDGNGRADMAYVHAAAKQIAPLLKTYTVIVTKSTVPVGTAEAVETIIKDTNPDADFDVCSNPEFLREGAAIGDFMRPDRVVIGVKTKRAHGIMKELYRPLYLNETPMLVTTPETAETIKYAANAFLATKITFINEIANLCEKTGANVKHVSRGMGLDGRIGAKFLHAGPGYGGSCFPKDTQALTQIGLDHGAPQTIVQSVVTANENRRNQMVDKIISACGGSVDGLKLGILGLSFKPNTDDMREAPSLSIIPALQQAGADVTAYDPVAMNHAKQYFSGVAFADNTYEAAADADALIIITEWNEFRTLDFERLLKAMKTPRLIDLRNIFSLKEMENSGLDYISVGRKTVNASS